MKEFILFEFKFTTVAVSLIKKFKFKREEIKRKFKKICAIAVSFGEKITWIFDKRFQVFQSKLILQN